MKNKQKQIHLKLSTFPYFRVERLKSLPKFRQEGFKNNLFALLAPNLDV